MKLFLDTFRHVTFAVLCAFGLLLAGCGGGSSGDGGAGAGGDGSDGGVSGFNENPAVIEDEADAEAGAEAARESARQAVLNEESSNVPLPGGIQSEEIQLHKDTVDMTNLVLLSEFSPTGNVVDSQNGDCGGSYTVSVDESTFDGSVVYNNYCSNTGSGQSVIDGRFDIDYQSNSVTEYVMQYDYTLTYLGQTYRYQGSRRCDTNGCSEETEYVGTNGRRYRSQDVSVQYDGNSYSVSATVYDGERGYVRYEADNLVMCESGIGFTSGAITVSDNGGAVVSIVFDGCINYSVEFKGNSFLVTY